MYCFVRQINVPCTSKLQNEIIILSLFEKSTRHEYIFLFVLNTLNPLLKQLPNYFLFRSLSWEIWFSFQSIDNPISSWLWIVSFECKLIISMRRVLSDVNEAQFYWRQDCLSKIISYPHHRTLNLKLETAPSNVICVELTLFTFSKLKSDIIPLTLYYLSWLFMNRNWRRGDILA